MSAALKLVPETEQLSRKPPLGEKWPKPQLVWENPKLTDRTQKGKSDVKPNLSYGRVLYNYFRYYDPATGRYITSDPIGLDGGLNTFGYALNNPLIYFDPLGLVCRKTGSRGTRCSPGPGRGGGRVGVFGCLIGCVSFTQGDSEAQASMQPTIGGGLSLCSAPKEPEPSCEDEKEEEKDCGIYDPNCDDELNFGVSPPGRAGFLLSLSFNEDGSVCVNVGPHAGLPGPSVGLGGLSE